MSKLRKEEFICPRSEDRVHPGGEGMSAATQGSWSVTLNLQSGGRREECWHFGLFPILISLDAQPMQWCCPHSRWLYFLELSP